MASTVSFDADSISQRVLERLRSKESWSNVLSSSTVQQLISPFAEELSYLASYDAFLTRENKWDLARNKTSLLGFQGIHRYQAHRQIGSEGVLTLSADETFNVVPAKNITIPKYTQFSTDNDVKFVAKDTYAITTSDVSIDIEAIQGIAKSFTHLASGDDFEEFSLINENIENSFFELSVNGVTWTFIENIFEATASQKVYELTNKIDFSGIYIKFGNNINGKKLEAGDSVIFRYVETQGFDGNIATANTVTTVDSTILDIDNDSVDVYVKNDDAMVGGQNFEEIEAIRANAPKFFQTGDRASNNSDYEQIMLDNFSYILKVTVWGTYENNIDDGNNPWETIPLEENNVFVAIVRTDLSESLSDAQKLEVSEELNNYKAPTDIVVFNDSEIIHIVFVVTASISDKTFTLSDVKSNINEQLKTYYNLEGRDFFEHIRFSDYQRVIDEATGVDYHSTTVKFYKDYSFSPTWTVDFDLPMTPITTSSVEIYVKDIVNDTAEFLMGTDNGSGNIIGEVGYDLTGSSLSYTTGSGAIVLDNDPPVLTEAYSNYRVRIFYKTTATDLVLKERNQIFDYDEIVGTDEITTQYV